MNKHINNEISANTCVIISLATSIALILLAVFTLTNVHH